MAQFDCLGLAVIGPFAVPELSRSELSGITAVGGVGGESSSKNRQ
jgi:hypothetical protein